MIEVDCRKCVNCIGEGCIPLEQALKAEYNKAIDDFVEHIRTYYTLKQKMGYVATTYKDLINYIFELAEQLKAGASDGNG